jgi:superoxide dismutase, Cu-Zn family
VPSSRRTLGWCLALVIGAGACSGHVELPNGGEATGGQPGSSGAAGAGGKLSSGSGSSGSSGAAANPAGAAGASGAGASVAGAKGEAAAGQTMGGAVSNEAEAQLVPTAGMTSGTVHFTAKGEQVEMVVTLTGCPEGPHGLHLHANPACGDSANAAGGHWSPQGEGIGDVMCAADGSALLSFVSEPGVWSIGAPAASDVLQHAIILHAGPSQPNPGARIACGIPTKLP